MKILFSFTLLLTPNLFASDQFFSSIAPNAEVQIAEAQKHLKNDLRKIIETAIIISETNNEMTLDGSDTFSNCNNLTLSWNSYIENQTLFDHLYITCNGETRKITLSRIGTNIKPLTANDWLNLAKPQIKKTSYYKLETSWKTFVLEYKSNSNKRSLFVLGTYSDSMLFEYFFTEQTDTRFERAYSMLSEGFEFKAWHDSSAVSSGLMTHKFYTTSDSFEATPKYFSQLMGYNFTFLKFALTYIFPPAKKTSRH